jgi:cell division protein YceG involved in septum cleavage
MDSGALFYVATGNGGHYFSMSYKDHLQAVLRYRTMEGKK